MSDAPWKVLWFCSKEGRTNISISIPDLYNIFLHPICLIHLHFAEFCFCPFSSLKRFFKKSTAKSPQKMLSDEIAKKISTWISEATSKCIQMWQIHFFFHFVQELIALLKLDIQPAPCKQEPKPEANSEYQHCLLILFTWLHFWQFLQYSSRFQCDYDKRLR